MERQVFGYANPWRIGGLVIVAALNLASLWDLRNRPHSGTSGNVYFDSSILGNQIFALIIMAAIAYVKYCRVEVDIHHVRWFNWLGREIVRGSRSSAHLLPPSFDLTSRRQIETDGGTINVHTDMMRGFRDLEKLLSPSTPVPPKGPTAQIP